MKRKYFRIATVFSILTLIGFYVVARMNDDSFSPEFLAELSRIEPDQIYRVAEVRHSRDLSPPVRLIADGKPIDIGQLSSSAHAGPCIADVDGDGDRDLLVGDFPGFFWLFDNQGTEKAPVYTSSGKLQAGGVDAKTPIY
jgi:hypothetical protein